MAPEGLTMPGHDGLGLDDDNSRTPISPTARQPDPEQAIDLAQARPFGVSLVDRELLAKSKILESETPAAGESQVD
jgi:hypothetical protein